MSPSSSADHGDIPVLLLKTESGPSDAYRELFSNTSTTAATAASDDGHRFSPRFVPVLRHRFEEPGMSRLRAVLRTRQISREPGSSYGGLIFTSQRAVEALAKIVQDDDATQASPATDSSSSSWPHLHDIPIYSVGPATTRALAAVPQSPSPLRIFGEHTGNGDALARFILDHYAEWYPDRDPKPPLLFPVGEQRRDVIPRTLAGGAPGGRRIQVDEEVVYGTGVMESFPGDFADVLRRTSAAPQRWVVVFSPTGCDGMLRALGLLDAETGRAARDVGSRRDGKTYIVTIGPTTQSYLRTTFGFEPDVCAERPSPEGVLEAILDFQSRRST